MNTPLIPAREDDIAAEPSDSLGGRLGAARQARGLSQDQIANQLHLATATIDALEHDDYGALPDDVFITGYIRKYARLVGLAPEPLLAAYRAPPRRTSPQRVGGALAAGYENIGSYKNLALISLGILILLALATFLWRQDRQPDTGMETVTAEDMTETTAPAAGPEMDRDPAMSALSEDPDSILVPEPDLPATAAADGEQGDTDESATGATDREPAAEPGEEETDGEETTADTANAVVVSFEGSSWVDIRDSEQKYKLFGTMKKGARHVLGGKPPYSLKIGNTAPVRITVGGKPFDLGPVSKGSVARFTLDPDKLP